MSSPEAQLPAIINQIAAAGINPLKTLSDWRALFYQATPVVVSTLVGVHAFTGDQANLWVPAILGVVTPIISYVNSTDKTRSILYIVLGLLQAVALIAGLFPNVSAYVPVIGAVITVFSSFLARHYTPTTSVIPASPPSVSTVA